MIGSWSWNCFFILLFIFLLIRLPQRPQWNSLGSPSKFDRDHDKSDDRGYSRSYDDYINSYYDDRYGGYDDEEDYDEDEEAAESDRLLHELFLNCEKAQWARIGRKVPDNFMNPFEFDD